MQQTHFFAREDLKCILGILFEGSRCSFQQQQPVVVLPHTEFLWGCFTQKESFHPGHGDSDILRYWRWYEKTVYTFLTVLPSPWIHIFLCEEHLGLLFSSSLMPLGLSQVHCKLGGGTSEVLQQSPMVKKDVHFKKHSSTRDFNLSTGTCISDALKSYLLA